jgi:two-component sensor histidine kinase
MRLSQFLDGENERELVFEWLESGGPPVTPPSNRGFGSRLIRMGLVGTGGVDLSYEPTGVRAVMNAPLSQVQES